MKRILLFAFIFIISSCKKEDTIYRQIEGSIVYKDEIDYSPIIIKVSSRNDSILCCMTAYEFLQKTRNKYKSNELYQLVKNNDFIEVEPKEFLTLKEHKIDFDVYTDSIYKENGIHGILEYYAENDTVLKFV